MELLLIFLLISGLLWLIFNQSRPLRQKGDDDSSGELEMNKEAGNLTSPLVYQGENLDFTEDVLRKVLLKHFPFYSKLIPPDQDKFLSRLKKFIKIKYSFIHDVKGYREMPILISAAAIQLSFRTSKIHHAPFQRDPDLSPGVYRP